MILLIWPKTNCTLFITFFLQFGLIPPKLMILVSMVTVGELFFPIIFLIKYLIDLPTNVPKFKKIGEMPFLKYFGP